MPPPPDAAALARVKAALEKMTPHEWSLSNCSHGGAIIRRGSGAEPLADRHPQSHLQVVPAEDAQAIVALVNAAPALVAGCETLLRVEALMRDLMREARRLRDAGVEDDTNDRWIAAGERENLACRLRDLLAALDAARAE